MAIISGSSHPELSEEIAQLIGIPLVDATLSRFSDGEVSIKFNNSISGKNVFIIQPCSSPVNDSVVELLLTVSCARRSGARRVIAVIPYFAYKHHRRSSSSSQKHHSQYLKSSAVDFAKMLESMGIDRVIAVDLQRPGQGHEACFFDNTIPLETIITTDHMVSHLINNIPLQNPIVVVAPNAECVKKARSFQIGLQKVFKSDVQLAIYTSNESGSGPADISQSKMLGSPRIEGADVVIVDDMIDTAGTLSTLSNKLKLLGAKNIYVVASHGLFTENSMSLIDLSPVNQVVVTNTLPLPKEISSKVEQVSIAQMVAHVILAEHFRSVSNIEDKYEIDD
eukprot:gene18195-23856_t